LTIRKQAARKSWGNSCGLSIGKWSSNA